MTRSIVPEEVKIAAADCVQNGKRVELLPHGKAFRDRVRALLLSLLEENPKSPDVRLVHFQRQYLEWDMENKALCSWDDIQARLLAKECYYLKLAEVMEQGGILFGIDSDGNPLVADAGNEPVLKNLSYIDARKAVYFKSNEPTGYEMFPVAPDEQKGTEISQFEKFTKGPFIGVYLGGEGKIQSSWLESGEISPKNIDPQKKVYDAYFDPQDNRVEIYSSSTFNEKIPTRGVRRLLRIKVDQEQR